MCVQTELKTFPFSSNLAKTGASRRVSSIKSVVHPEAGNGFVLRFERLDTERIIVQGPALHTFAMKEHEVQDGGRSTGDGDVGSSQQAAAGLADVNGMLLQWQIHVQC